MPNPVIDLDKCTGCGTCVEICPMSVFALEKGKSKVVNGDCIGCKACEVQCPANAIVVKD